MRRNICLLLLGGALTLAACEDDDTKPTGDGGAGRGGSGGSGGAGGGGTGGSTDAAASDVAAGDMVGGETAGDVPTGDIPVASDAPAASNMSFFVTSAGKGTGGNLGGLAGADAHCKALAMAAGSTKQMWFAYLSTNQPQVHARSRIGQGPWFNARGVKIADNVEHLHQNMGMSNALNVDNALDEKGQFVPGRDATRRPAGVANDHDIITGSTVEGMALANFTCADWTSAEITVKTQVGHSDKDGPTGRVQWNSAHESAGCAEGRSQMGGIGSGGGSGRFYCFATD